MIHLHHRSDLSPGIDQASLLGAVGKAAEGNKWLELSSGRGRIDYQVAVNKKGCYEIWDPSGKKIKILRPDLLASEAGAAEGVVLRLEHLTKFNAARDLRNYDPASPLAGKLIVELVGKASADYDPSKQPHPKPFDDPTQPSINSGEWLFLRVKNGFPEHQKDSVLNITVLDLQPDWGISQVYPSGAAEWFVPLDPGKEVLIPFIATLPEGHAEGTDTIKVFATLQEATQWPQLPVLDPIRATTSELLARKILEPAHYPSKVWTTDQIEIEIKKV